MTSWPNYLGPKTTYHWTWTKAPGLQDDMKPTYWLETSVTGDAWLFFKDGCLAIAKGRVAILLVLSEWLGLVVLVRC